MATWRDVDVQLLRAWRDDPARTVPAARLAHAAGVDTVAVAGRVAGLRAAGYVIDGPSAGDAAYRLVTAPARLIGDDLRAARPEWAVIGREIIVFEETDSTNDLAARAGHAATAEGLVIFAEAQRAGRGRLGRRWMSPPGQNLLLSVLLRPPLPVASWPELTFCAALAVAETAERYTGRPARIKWPNDVLLDGRKVAGILLETHRGGDAGFVVVGIGLNVLQREADFAPELRGRAGSLATLRTAAAETGELERRPVAAFLLERMEHHYGHWPGESSAVRELCAQRGCIPPPGS